MTRQVRQQVESCLTIGPPRGPLADMNGVWNWYLLGCAAKYSIHTKYQELRVTVDHGIRAEQSIPLSQSTPYFGGIRWWFLCPKCNRRVALLHKPSNSHWFFCRHCHDLTYESVQSRGTERADLFKGIAEAMQISTREAARWYRLEAAPIHIHEIKRPVDRVRNRRTGVALLLTKKARSQGLSL
jgi:hypothetical protein